MGLRCRLIDVDIIDRPGLGIPHTSEIVQYEALSYSWGHEAPDFVISCDRKSFRITRELATALHSLRYFGASRFIWCDAISVNQADLAEKAFQVQNMLRIFEKAKRVVAWLGLHEESENIFQAFSGRR